MPSPRGRREHEADARDDPVLPPRPRLSVATSFDYGVPIEDQVPLIAAAGFTHLSLGGNEPHARYLSAAARRELTRRVAAHGLAVDTVHGPRADGAEADDLLARTAEAAADLGAAVVVVHGGPFDFPAADLSSRLDRLLAVGDRLVGVAAATGVRFALENVMPGPATELVRRAVLDLDDEAVGFCYDSAHDQIGGPRPLGLLVEMRDRLTAVHLSDRLRDFVDHVPPGDGFVDWAGVAGLLRGAAFRGPLLLEVATTHSRVKEPAAFLAAAYASGCRLHAMVTGAADAEATAD